MNAIFTQSQVTAIVNREVARALEMAAQRLYDAAEMQTADLQCNLFCAAAEGVRRVADGDMTDNPYVYNGELA